jgi:hypothetical protein
VNPWTIDLIYVAPNVVKSATTDEDVKRTYIVRILNPSLFYFLLCLVVFTLYYASFIYTLYYTSFISTLHYVSFICTFSCADSFFDIWWDGTLVPTHGGGVQDGPSRTVHRGWVGSMKCIFVCPFILFRSVCTIK